jgi:hypothetical protein
MRQRSSGADVIGVGGIDSVVVGSFEVRFLWPWLWRHGEAASMAALEAAADYGRVSLNLAGQEGGVLFLLGF